MEINKIYYYDEKTNKNNFGDICAPYIFEKLTNKKPIKVAPSNDPNNPVILITGSIAGSAKRGCILWGCGIMTANKRIRRVLKVCAVRGPYTLARAKINNNCTNTVIGDPVLLMSDLYKPTITKKYKLGIIPHYVDYDLVFKKLSNKSDVKIIKIINESVEKFIDEVLECEVLLSSSLHGCVIAHSYNIPVAWCKFSNLLCGDGIKFLDYYSGIGLSMVNEPIIIDLDKFDFNNIIKIIEKYSQPTQKTILNIKTNLLNSFPCNKINPNKSK